MRRVAIGIALVLTAASPACGDDRKPDRTIAFLRTSPIPAASQEAFLDELEQAGWTIGENLAVLNDDPEAVFADDDELAAAVDGFVDGGADVLVGLSTAAAAAAMENDDEVPVLVVANDPVAAGLLSDVRAPEGVVTGVAFRVPADRTIDLARQLLGDESAVGLLSPGDDDVAAPIVEEMREAGKLLGVRVFVESFIGDDEAREAVDRLVDADVGAIILVNAPATVRAHAAIEEATTAAGIPVVANTNVNEFAVLVLAPDNIAVYGQLGRQAARLLDGLEVSDVPLEEPAAFNMVLREEIADRLQLELSDDLLRQAARVSD